MWKTALHAFLGFQACAMARHIHWIAVALCATCAAMSLLHTIAAEGQPHPAGLLACAMLAVLAFLTALPKVATHGLESTWPCTHPLRPLLNRQLLGQDAPELPGPHQAQLETLALVALWPSATPRHLPKDPFLLTRLSLRTNDTQNYLQGRSGIVSIKAHPADARQVRMAFIRALQERHGWLVALALCDRDLHIFPTVRPSAHALLRARTKQRATPVRSTP